MVFSPCIHPFIEFHEFLFWGCMMNHRNEFSGGSEESQTAQRNSLMSRHTCSGISLKSDGLSESMDRNLSTGGSWLHWQVSVVKFPVWQSSQSAEANVRSHLSGKQAGQEAARVMGTKCSALKEERAHLARNKSHFPLQGYLWTPERSQLPGRMWRSVLVFRNMAKLIRRIQLGRLGEGLPDCTL